MFVKEAEEKKPPYACCTLDTNCELWKDGFQKGAEFGYNKANEWHYPSKGELPKDNDEKLCFYGKGKVVARYNSEYSCWETYFNNLETVIPSSVIIAWKEIELPKESKEK